MDFCHTFILFFGYYFSLFFGGVVYYQTTENRGRHSTHTRHHLTCTTHKPNVNTGLPTSKRDKIMRRVVFPPTAWSIRSRVFPSSFPEGLNPVFLYFFILFFFFHCIPIDPQYTVNRGQSWGLLWTDFVKMFSNP